MLCFSQCVLFFVLYLLSLRVFQLMNVFPLYRWQCSKTKKLFPKEGEKILCEEIPLLHSNAAKEIQSSVVRVGGDFPMRSFCSSHEMWPQTGNNEWEGSHDTPAFEQIILGLNWGDLDNQGHCLHQSKQIDDIIYLIGIYLIMCQNTIIGVGCFCC